MFAGPVKRRPSMSESAWTFLSNHTHVLVCLAANGDVLMRDVAAQVGITERQVQRIVAELEAAGVLRRERDGRRNVYSIDADIALRHPLESHCRIGDLLALVTPRAAPEPPPAAASKRASARARR